MSQITLPWIEPAPDSLANYRRSGLRLLFAIAALSLIAATAGLLALSSWKFGTRFNDAYVAVVFLFVLGPATGFLASMGGIAGILFHRAIAKFLRWGYVSLSLFLGGVVGVCVLAWAHGWIFNVIQSVPVTQIAQEDRLLGLDYPLSVAGIHEALLARDFAFQPLAAVARLPIFAYAIWPLQFEFVRDLVAMGGIIGFISIIPLFGIWWERKASARIQSRMGPMRTGGWHGWLQSPADGIKLIFKEDIIPPEGDPVLFKLAPYITFVPPICAFIALPFAGAWVFRDLDVALIFILAMLGIEVVGVILAGWASNNKWSVYGAMREACQMVSYEIPMGMSLLIPIMMAGTLKLTAICDAQSGGPWNWFMFANPWCFAAFFVYYTAALASCKRAPFDLPESESELVAGFLTEYSGFRWSLFFFGEYAAMFIVSGLAVILFMGGWTLLPNSMMLDPDTWYGPLVNGLLFHGPIIFVLKAAFLFYVQLWVRWTLPRIRIDQVLYACVQVLLPMTMVLLLANTIWILLIEHVKVGWLIALDAALHWVLVAIGAILLVAMIGISLYGYKNNRRLVGKLAVDALPGS